MHPDLGAGNSDLQRGHSIFFFKIMVKSSGYSLLNKICQLNVFQLQVYYIEPTPMKFAIHFKLILISIDGTWQVVVAVLLENFFKVYTI